MIPIGTRVSWKRGHHLREWWTVTAHPQPGYLELDGMGSISEAMLEPLPDDEVAALQEIIAQQCELIAELSK